MNRLTLRVRDKEIARMVSDQNANNYRSQLPILLILALAWELSRFYEYFFSDSSLFWVVEGSIHLVFVVLSLLVYRLWPRHTPKVVILHLICFTVVTNLSLQDMLTIYRVKKTYGDTSMLEFTIVIHVINHNSFLTYLLVMYPILILSSHIYYTALFPIYHDA